MPARDDFVQRIVSRSGIMTPAMRRALERELRDHLDDAIEEARAQGCDEASLLRTACERFGDPDDIAREMAAARKFERSAISVAYSLALMGMSLLTVAGLILTFQLLVAIGSGISASRAFPHLREEFIGFASLALGYTGLYLEESLFHKQRLIKACVTNSTLFASLFAFTFFCLHVTLFMPLVAFASGLAARALQQTVLRSVWFLGTAVPMALASLLPGSLAGGSHHFPLWAPALIRWAGLTAACYSLTLLSRNTLVRIEMPNRPLDS
jgi:hypothetical protein